MSNQFGVVPLKETVAVWEVGESGMRGIMLEVAAGKRLRVTGRWRRRRGERLPGDFLRIPNLRSMPLVLSFHPATAYAAVLPFKKTFAAGSAKAHRLEFQAMIREILDRTNLELRALAARRLKVEDLDAVLLDARVMHLTADGIPVIHHLPDLSKKELRGMLHVVFTARPVFHDLHDLLHSGKELFVTERNKAAMAFLEHGSLEHKTSIRLLDLAPGAEIYTVFAPKEELPLKVAEFPWQGSVDRLLMREWGVSESAARTILDGAVENGASSRMADFLNRLTAESAETFEKALYKFRIGGEVHVRRTARLPFALPRTLGKAALAEFPFAENFKALGFEMAGANAPDPDLADLLLPFLEYYYHRGDPLSHRALTRQIHWIKQ